MIPAQAVEAALSALYPNKPSEFARLTWESTIRNILEAAAPHMLAEAWEEGRDAEFQRSVMKRQTDPNPYRK